MQACGKTPYDKLPRQTSRNYREHCPPADTELVIRHEVERTLMDRHGPLVGGLDLSRALGYPTAAAFRQALIRNSVPVRVFSIPNRRGRFALTRDVAEWLAACRASTNWDASRGTDAQEKEPTAG